MCTDQKDNSTPRWALGHKWLQGSLTSPSSSSAEVTGSHRVNWYLNQWFLLLTTKITHIQPWEKSCPANSTVPEFRRATKALGAAPRFSFWPLVEQEITFIPWSKQLGWEETWPGQAPLVSIGVVYPKQDKSPENTAGTSIKQLFLVRACWYRSGNTQPPTFQTLTGKKSFGSYKFIQTHGIS